MGPEKGLYLLCSDRDCDRAAAGLISFPEGGKPSCPHALSGSRVAVQCLGAPELRGKTAAGSRTHAQRLSRITAASSKAPARFPRPLFVRSFVPSFVRSLGSRGVALAAKFTSLIIAPVHPSAVWSFVDFSSLAPSVLSFLNFPLTGRPS